MEKSISQYQKAFNTMVERLKNNEQILAAMVFGSMVTGDLWDKSDIDMFVVTSERISDIKNIYMEEMEIPVHVKFMSKSKFLKLHTMDLKGGFMHRIFASSRLVFSKDQDITTYYDKGRFYPDLDRERWNMVYFGKLLKNIDVCRKYLHNDGVYTAYTSAIKCSEEFAKLYVNLLGYMISKDATIMAMDLNDAFKERVDELFFNKEDVIKAIENMLTFIEKYVEANLKEINSILLEYMQSKDSFLSAEDIKKDALFSDFDISIEAILEKLSEKEVIKKETRPFKTNNGKVLFNEIVFFV